MNKITTFFILFIVRGYSFSPSSIWSNYQAVIRDAQLQIVAEKNVSVRFSILKEELKDKLFIWKHIRR